jgi:hypothetical protein
MLYLFQPMEIYDVRALVPYRVLHLFLFQDLLRLSVLSSIIGNQFGLWFDAQLLSLKWPIVNMGLKITIKGQRLFVVKKNNYIFSNLFIPFVTTVSHICDI